MRDGPLVFVDIDTQRDFLEPGGALFIAGSEAILPNLERLSRYAQERGIPVIATACAHTTDEVDPEPFPPHCLVGTRGQERIEATARADGITVGVDERFESEADAGALPKHLTIEKRRYDLFSHPDAKRIIELYDQSRPTFVIFGVATDYCVQAAVTGLLQGGKHVAVVTDAIRAIDESAVERILLEFEHSGARLVTTEEVCS